MYRTHAELGTPEEKNVDQYSVVEIAHANHKAQLLSENRVVCVDNYADWCGPCRTTAPDYAFLASVYSKPGQCILVKENIEKKISPHIQITGVPAFHFFVNGKLVDQIVGWNPQELESKLKALTMTNPQSQPSQEMNGPPASRNTIRNFGSPYRGQSLNPPAPSGPLYHQW